MHESRRHGAPEGKVAFLKAAVAIKRALWGPTALANFKLLEGVDSVAFLC